ncbi:hypothetical protein L1987_46713 [Smallanthus sonchifolius]|uniref:Uncharacterized protein n=1 Tax=Smallanthus sonchifolius TaxID=185202 RepID=A0ACB9G294_9ASTR|nr:hypothetical protein L1987_46713 [Smallanthus sonchifolius]
MVHDSCLQGFKALITDFDSLSNFTIHGHVLRLHMLYESWEDNFGVGFVVMKGNGSAFCVGADIVSVRDMIKKGGANDIDNGDEQLDHMIMMIAYKKWEKILHETIALIRVEPQGIFQFGPTNKTIAAVLWNHKGCYNFGPLIRNYPH